MRFFMQKANCEKNVVIYCRESRDDYGENYERIETQRNLLVKYCKSKGFTNIVDIIMDDDKSGTDFNRFNNIKLKAQNKEIDVIVFKNSARLGRNQKEALELVEFFEEQGVEIIFEDEQYNEEMFGLYAWFNERRARDDSKNIRRNLRHKIEEGNLLVKAIYGYNKNGNKLEINKETEPVVKEIYELYSKHWGYKKIATHLNVKGIPTPSQSRNFVNAKQTQNWNVQHIARILDDRRYVGDYVGGKTEKVSFKSKKTRVKSQDKWTIIENHHEAIIEKDLFEKVQKIRAERKKENFMDNNSYRYVIAENNSYSGLLYCGKCGKAMYKRNGYGKRPDCYICKKYSCEGAEKNNYRPGYGCVAHRIKIEVLDKIVKMYVEKLTNNQELISNTKLTNLNKINLENNLNKSKENLYILKKQYKQIYEDKLNNVIPEFLYIEKKQELEQKIKKEKANIDGKNKLYSVVNNPNCKEKIVLNVIEEIKQNGLTKEELSILFKKIVIFAPQEITKEQKLLYNLTDMMYNVLYEIGGLVFIY